jgi:hypothetical protein
MTLRKLVSILFGATLAAGCGKQDSRQVPRGPPVFSTFQKAAVVIGQPDFTSSAGGAVNATSVGLTVGNPAFAGGKLFIPGFGDNRVLVFPGIPSANGASASFALGQPDLTSDGGGLSASTLWSPEGIAVAGTTLVVNELLGNRVLIWNALPSASGAPADVAVGQDGFDTDGAGCAANRLFQPRATSVGPGKLVVADTANARVLAFDAVPTTSGASASLVLGQPDFTSCAATFAGPTLTASTMAIPVGVWTDGTRLAVVDQANNRILVWLGFPTSSGQAADLVLGQASFDRGAANDDAQTGSAGSKPSARTFSGPTYLDSDGTRLVLSDTGNNRVLLWKTFPTSSFQPADVVIGQGDFAHAAPNDDAQAGVDGSAPSARTLSSPAGVKLVAQQLLVGDGGNRRVLVFDAE